MSNVKATPRAELNALLRDSGVSFWCVQGITFWNGEDDRECMAYEYESGGEVHLALKMLNITPLQAIAATVGAGACEIDVLNTGECADYECLEYITAEVLPQLRQEN